MSAYLVVVFWLMCINTVIWSIIKLCQCKCCGYDVLSTAAVLGPDSHQNDIVTVTPTSASGDAVDHMRCCLFLCFLVSFYLNSHIWLSYNFWMPLSGLLCVHCVINKLLNSLLFLRCSVYLKKCNLFLKIECQYFTKLAYQLNEWMKVQWFKVHSKARSRLCLTHLPVQPLSRVKLYMVR